MSADGNIEMKTMREIVEENLVSQQLSSRVLASEG